MLSILRTVIFDKYMSDASVLRQILNTGIIFCNFKISMIKIVNKIILLLKKISQVKFAISGKK